MGHNAPRLTYFNKLPKSLRSKHLERLEFYFVFGTHNAIERIVTNQPTKEQNMHPPQCTPGQYTIHHPDYTSPLTINIRQNEKGTMFWDARIDSNEPFRRKMYLGEIHNKVFWNSVYVELAVDKRNPYFN